MEVDELSGGGGDPENQLVNMFSSMATEDKDNLVKALQAVVGSAVSPASCKFFLELANWNLSAAIGAYYDFDFSQQQQHQQQQLDDADPEAAAASGPRLAILSCQVAHRDDAIAVACTVYNESTMDCPPGCRLVCAPEPADADGVTALCEPCQLPSLRPGGNCCCRLLLPLPSRAEPSMAGAAAAEAAAAAPRHDHHQFGGFGLRVRLRLHAPDGSPLTAPASARCLDLACRGGADAADAADDADAVALAAAASWASAESPLTENPPPSPSHIDEQMME